MKLWPRSTAWRLIATLLFAGVAVVGLDFAVRQADAAAKPRRARQFVPAALPPPVRLAAVTGPILLATQLAVVPAAAAPVVQVFADGGYALRRPSPLPNGPAAAGVAAAIVLPTGDLTRLDSRARATFAEILGVLVADRPLLAARFVTLDFVLQQAELERLLAWVR